MHAIWRRIWNFTAGGFCFAVLGIGALTLGVLVLPALRWLPASARHDLRAQQLVQRACRAYLLLARTLRMLNVRTEGMEALDGAGPRLLVANHPTLVDVVALLAFLPQADCIVNVARSHNFFLRHLIAGTGYVPNDSGPEVVRECVERLRAGRSVLIFPEGTRSPRGGLGRFQRGAAHIALELSCELQPVLVSCDPPTLAKGSRWYDLPDRPIEMGLRPLAPIPSAGLVRSGLASPAAARRLTAELREALAKGLGVIDVGRT